MTGSDRAAHHPGYWPSAWPVECGGNRRQKAARGRLGAADGTATANTRRNGRWNVMVVERDPGQWYLGGTTAYFSGPTPFGWVERIDPATLEPLAASPELPCGDHVWCGAILAHANGSIYSVNGSYLHRLDPDDLAVLVERQLPADRSHNGMLALADGTLITKDLRLEGQGGTIVTRLCPETLELVHEPLVLPEASMGRIAADLDSEGAESVYVPGSEHLWRLVVHDDRLEVDAWRPRYRRRRDRWGLAWDSCLSAGACWIMDCGDVESVRLIHRAHPNGRFDAPPGRDLSWRRPAPWPGAQRLLRIPLTQADGAGSGVRSDIQPGIQPGVQWIEPFGTPGGGIIAPPVHVPELDMAIAWDSVNGGLAGIRTGDSSPKPGDSSPKPGDSSPKPGGSSPKPGDSSPKPGGGSPRADGGALEDESCLEVAWHLDVRPSMQPVVFPDSGELAINDYTDAGTDDIVVVDIASGALLDRCQTGSRIGNGMFLTPDGNRGLFYCTTLTVAHISWA